MIIMAKATREGSATRGSKSIPGRPARPIGQCRSDRLV